MAVEVKRNNNIKNSFNKGYTSSTSSEWNKNKDFNKFCEKKPTAKAIPRYPRKNEGNQYSNINSRSTICFK